MKITNPETLGMTPGLERSLADYRRKRGFVVLDFIDAKIHALNTYMNAHGLKGCVIGLSGGIDSSVSLALLLAAADRPNSPIEKIVGLGVSALGSLGVSNQRGIVNKVDLLKRRFPNERKLRIESIDITAPMLQVIDKVAGEAFPEFGNTDWTEGQLAATSRTPIFYYLTSLLAEQNCPSVVIGTINRDEGAYLGYVGKASDGMVDIQLISDLHKSEVRALARHFDLPKEIIDAPPSPDMADGRTDEELFGASYDFVELFLADHTIGVDFSHWSEEDDETFYIMADRLEKVHDYNAHKYIVGDPAIHLDVLPSAVTFGWTKPNKNVFFQNDKFVNHKDVRFTFDRRHDAAPLTTPLKHGVKVHGLMSRDEASFIRGDVLDEEWVYAGLDGRAISEFSPEPAGSRRLSVYSEEAAKTLWERLQGLIPALLDGRDSLTTDGGNSWWRAVGVNPLFRFIHYPHDLHGFLVPHYDAPYHYGPDKRTLKSLVIGLEVGEGCGTRFLKDGYADISLLTRDLDDRTDMNVQPEDILETVVLSEGDAVIFDHRLLHDSEPIPIGASKLIVRSDIVYERCGSRG